MSTTDNPGVIGRRSLLAAMGMGATALASPLTVAAVPRSQVKQWDITTDVLVAGSGAAGICAALEAHSQGAQVLVLEALLQFGGSSAMSGGVVYAGGGTSLQRAAGVHDTPENMYKFIVSAGGPHPQLDKIQRYCEDSVSHFDWLMEQGVPYQGGFSNAKGLPMGDESLYYSGNELAWPPRELATPAPRGHVPAVAGMNGGRRLMEVLLSRARGAGIQLQSQASGRHLIVESDGRIAGIQVTIAGEQKNVRTRRGVVLACGGFIHNREMLKHYAPQLYDCSVPWGNAGDLGEGINMGIAVGAVATRMHEGFAIAPIYPPENVLSGILVNQSGQRFIAEDSYHGVLGDSIAFHQGGKAWLITDQASSFQIRQDNFLQVARGNTIGDIADKIGFPRGALQNTVAYYNQHAHNGSDPMFHKNAPYVRPLQGPPYRAWDISTDKAFFPAHTFGGLQTRVGGQVLGANGEDIPGLYAAGRNAAGLPMAPYIASGISLGDCTYFGRLAGRNIAAESVTV